MTMMKQRDIRELSDILFVRKLEGLRISTAGNAKETMSSDKIDGIILGLEVVLQNIELAPDCMPKAAEVADKSGKKNKKDKKDKKKKHSSEDVDSSSEDDLEDVDESESDEDE